jgi:hypothetical protein
MNATIVHKASNVPLIRCHDTGVSGYGVPPRIDLPAIAIRPLLSC